MARDFMDWNYCERKYVKSVEVDVSKARSMAEVAESRIIYWKGVRVDDDNVSLVVEGYYEAMKELLTSLFFAKGLKSSNHLCLFSYFYKMFPDYEKEGRFLLRMNEFRNGLNYYGEFVDSNWYEGNRLEILRVIEVLREIVGELV